MGGMCDEGNNLSTFMSEKHKIVQIFSIADDARRVVSRAGERLWCTDRFFALYISNLTWVSLTGETMNSCPHNFDDLQDRLLKLEKQNRRFKQLAVAVPIVPGLLLVMGQGSSRKIVEANEFVLRDNSGNMRARLSVDDVKFSTVQLVLFDKEGVQRIKLDSSDVTGGTLTLASSHGKDQVFLSGFPSGGVLQLDQEHDESRTVMQSGSIRLMDLKNKAELTAGPGIIGIGDSEGVFRTILDGDALRLSDPQGFSASFGVTDLITPSSGETHRTSAASLVLFDKKKNVIWKAP
jgi:hypothetical protein